MIQRQPDTQAAYGEIRKMVASAASVLLLLGAFTGVFLEKVRRETLFEQEVTAQKQRELSKKLEAAEASFEKLQLDNQFIANENEGLRKDTEAALRENEMALDRMQGLSAKLAVYGAVVAKNIETTHPSDLRDAPSNEVPKGAIVQERTKITELERQVELQRMATLYFAKYLESVAQGRKADPAKQRALLDNALNAAGATEQQYQELGKPDLATKSR